MLIYGKLYIYIELFFNKFQTTSKNFTAMELFFWQYFKLESFYNINNRSIVNIVEQIGREKYNETTKEKQLKRGIQRICNKLQEQNVFITKRQIKVFINLIRNEHGIIRIPYNFYKIFNAIVTLVDEDVDVKKYCKQVIVKNRICEQVGCINILVPEFSKLLYRNLDKIEQNNKANIAYVNFRNHTKYCRKI